MCKFTIYLISKTAHWKFTCASGKQQFCLRAYHPVRISCVQVHFGLSGRGKMKILRMSVAVLTFRVQVFICVFTNIEMPSIYIHNFYASLAGRALSSGPTGYNFDHSPAKDHTWSLNLWNRWRKFLNHLSPCQNAGQGAGSDIMVLSFLALRRPQW